MDPTTIHITWLVAFFLLGLCVLLFVALVIVEITSKKSNRRRTYSGYLPEADEPSDSVASSSETGSHGGDFSSGGGFSDGGGAGGDFGGGGHH